MGNLDCMACVELNYGPLCDKVCSKDETEVLTQWYNDTAEYAEIAGSSQFGCDLGTEKIDEEELRRAKDLLQLLKALRQKKEALGQRYTLAPGDVQLRLFAAHKKATKAIGDALASLKKMAAEERESQRSFTARCLQAV